MICISWLICDCASTLMKDEPLRQYTLRGYDGTAFVEALSLLSELPSLEHLVLNFRASDGPFKSDTEGSARDRDFPPEVVLQFLIFRALAENEHGYPSPLKSLVIDKFLPLPHPYLGSPTILGLLSTLSHLAINTTTQCKAFPMTDPQLEWPSSYHLFQKEALSASLVSLQLHHACVRSADSLAPISEVVLPRLAYLSLQRTYFSEQGEVENFIARHGGTLRELKLFLCPMAMSTNWQVVASRRPTHFRRWARVWEHLDRDLKVLKNLVVSERHNSIGIEDANLGRYIDNCYRCNVVMLEGMETAEDDRVFARFKNAVELRSQ